MIEPIPVTVEVNRTLSTGYIRLAPGKVFRTRTVTFQVDVDFNAADEVLGLKLYGVSRYFRRPQLPPPRREWESP